VRRTTAAVVGTLAGTALLVGARLGADVALGAGAASNPPLTPEAAAGAADPSVTPDPTAAASATSGPPATKTSPTQRKSPTATAAKTRSAAPPTTGTGLKTGTFAGASSTNEYGTIQVTITASGGRVTNVTASYPTSPSRTAQINARAIPTLKQEALTAQSANIASVSGATFTSDSYKVSLQSALNAAKG
jgi:uncharacterized protein with FMN-binding domain